MARSRPWRRPRATPSATDQPDQHPADPVDPARATTTATTPAAEPDPEVADPAPADPAEAGEAAGAGEAGRRGLRDRGPFPLLRAAHPRQAVATAAGLALAAALADRPTREVALVLATVLVGQAILGWHNDLVDRDRDRRHDLPGKPVAQGLLDPGTVWFAIACATLLLVPLSISTGVTAGCFYLASVAVGLLGDRLLRTGVLSWLSWAISFALYPYYLSYGGWGGEALGAPPQPAIVVLFALLGIGVHFLRALWGLVPSSLSGTWVGLSR